MKAKTTFALLLLLVGISVVAQAQAYPRATIYARADGTPHGNWEYLSINGLDFYWEYNGMVIWTNWQDGTPLALFVYDGTSSSNAWSAYVATYYALEAARRDSSTRVYIQAWTTSSDRCTADMGVCYVDLDPATGCSYYLIADTSGNYFTDHVAVTVRNPEGTYAGLNVGSTRVKSVWAYNHGGVRFDFYGNNQGGINSYYILTSWLEPRTAVFDEFAAVMWGVLSEGHTSVAVKARRPYQNYPWVLIAAEPMAF